MSTLPARPELPKRFYQDVSIVEEEGGFAVRLDGRPVRTPSRALLRVPSADVARAVAAEWEAQKTHIDPATMPMTRLVNTVLDGVAADLAGVAEDLGRYAETDLLAYRAAEPQRLVDRQTEGWDPVMDWARQRTGQGFARGTGVMFVAQPEASVETLRAIVRAETDPFRLAALHQMTTLTGSLLLALAVSEGFLDVERAWALAHIDEDWNIEQWGEDEEARARRDSRYRDMRMAAIMLGRA
ncbi:ATP12 family chaperone protein [Aureimonas sp. N4]|uniref:ATP12 family chaperone protein n=1 Tax=Aureimonas sp. N4 TaxID=1638165 RepID=UPI000784B49E|nr:ATP12 family protein [Aureimonas sp. N4]